MKQLGFCLLLILAYGSELGLCAQRITIAEGGSVAAHLSLGNSEPQLVALQFGLPRVPALRRWSENEVFRTQWMSNGVLYTQSVLVRSEDADAASPGTQSPANPVLLVNIEGENTNSRYTEASAELSVVNADKPEELELRDGMVWRVENRASVFVGALEIPDSGIKVSRGSTLQFSGNLPPSLKGSMTLKVPLTASEGETARERLRDLDFQEALRQALKTPKAPAVTRTWLLTFSTNSQTQSPKPTTNTRNFVPDWWPKAPPLPAPKGQIRHVRNAEELLKAVETLGSGETILMEAGHYRLPRVLILDGIKNVVLRGASGDPADVTLSGKGWDSGSERDDLLHIARCEGVTLADLTFADCRSYGVKVEAENAPKDIHLYNCRFRDIGVRALKGSAGNDPAVRAVRGSVRYCRFENTRIPPADWLFGGDYISAIDMMALEDWTFSDNLFRNIKGRKGGGRAAIFIWVRSRRVTVERNLIIDCDRGIAFGNPGQSTANRPGESLVYVAEGLIRNNMIVGGPDCGIELWHADQIKVLHNSIWRPEQNWSRGIRVGTGTARSEIRNNLVHGEIRFEGGEAQLSNNRAERLEGYFAAPDAGNLELTSHATGAIDQGELLDAVKFDIRARPRMGKADLGAWEWETGR